MAPMRDSQILGGYEKTWNNNFPIKRFNGGGECKSWTRVLSWVSGVELEQRKEPDALFSSVSQLGVSQIPRSGW